MALSLVLWLTFGLAALTFLMRGTGPFMSELPGWLTRRTTGLAPALLAALVAVQLTSPSGVLRLDVKALAVVVAALLSAARLPLVLCVTAGALAASAARALGFS